MNSGMTISARVSAPSQDGGFHPPYNARVNPPLPSATVVVLRDAPGLELLLLQRSARDGQPGIWVFPGGKVDPGDQHSGAAPADDARRAAVRETAEEAG